MERTVPIAVFVLALGFALPVFSNTYYFAGTINPVAPSPSISIPLGTPFTGKLTIDPSVPRCNCADDQHRNYDFNTGTPPGAWEVHIGSGLYDFSTTNIGMEEDHNYGLFFGGGDVIWFWANNPGPGTTITGTGQAANPIFFQNLASVLLWSKKPGNILADANTFSVANIVNIGQWSFAGIDFSIQQNQSNAEHYRGAFTSFTTTAPGSGPSKTKCELIILIILLILIALGLLGWRRRSQQRITGG
jgi:hypothetical protein